MKQATLYARMSTAKQGESIEKQVDLMKKYCLDNNLLISNIFIDEAMSGGRNNNRQELLNLVEQLRNFDDDVIVLYSLERISRSLLSLSLFNEILTSKGIELHTIRGRIDTSDDPGWISFIMEGFTGELERRRVKQRTKDALRRKISKGQHAGQIPYGKRLAHDGKHVMKNDERKCDHGCKGCRNLEHDPDEQRIIKLVAGMYQGGHTLAEIRDKINDMGYKTRSEGEFVSQQISRILQNGDGGYKPISMCVSPGD